jgi:hypothetical protein
MKRQEDHPFKASPQVKGTGETLSPKQNKNKSAGDIVQVELLCSMLKMLGSIPALKKKICLGRKLT